MMDEKIVLIFPPDAEWNVHERSLGLTLFRHFFIKKRYTIRILTWLLCPLSPIRNVLIRLTNMAALSWVKVIRSSFF